MAKLKPYCKACGGVYNCSCESPREKRLRLLEDACRDAEVQMDQAAELLADIGGQWATEKAEQLGSCAMNCREALKP